jgi:hypothetical protein
LPSTVWDVVMNNYDDVAVSGGSMLLEPYQFVVLEV